jgi:large subunit ribosomal protein L23
MLLKPLISEKSLAEAGKKKYTFKVIKTATKPEIKKAVEKAFGVKVLGVQTLTVPGKTYRSGKRWVMRQRGDWKKAIVAISPEKQIDLFEAATGK